MSTEQERSTGRSAPRQGAYPSLGRPSATPPNARSPLQPQPSDNTPPQTDDHAPWEEIVEISVLCQSGQLLVESLDLGPAEDLPGLASAGPGWYRIRVHAHGRNTNPDGTDSDPIERYMLTAWPSAAAETATLKSSQHSTAGLTQHTNRPQHGPHHTPPTPPLVIKPE
ncbi:hypothetical protein [Streptomyces torulosus]|uniref:hypothetical protein n=1 Tax=Streptomyces torulosus TaxID=68276 RepID=UPI0012FEDC79|nr:hypothetical protein [Streptomyces torulosus]